MFLALLLLLLLLQPYGPPFVEAGPASAADQQERPWLRCGSLRLCHTLCHTLLAVELLQVAVWLCARSVAHNGAAGCLPIGWLQYAWGLGVDPVLSWLLCVCVQHMHGLVRDTDGPCVAVHGACGASTAWQALLLHVRLWVLQV
jgi:hypothetical protein